MEQKGFPRVGILPGTLEEAELAERIAENRKDTLPLDNKIWHESVHDLFRKMVELGGTWISSDVPGRFVGFCRKDGTELHAVSLNTIKAAWGRRRDDPGRGWAEGSILRTLIRSPEGRRKIAHMISTGDHCLEFFEDPDVEQCDAVGPWGRCVYPKGHPGSHGICVDGYTAPGLEPSDARLRRLQIGMFDLIESGKATGRTREQVLDEFSKLMKGGRAALNALCDGDFDAVRREIRVRVTHGC